MIELIDKLAAKEDLSSEEFLYLLRNLDASGKAYLIEKADAVRRKHYDDKVYMRGLIEISSYCKQHCIYCGIRAENKNAQRYRLTLNQIISACDEGYRLGYRTFVIQGG
ncbi:MAG: [FeFe] hydrogenase H-cluster radical SAM maturase HydE, partial [Clostridia bacterium]|nr:[FeFe] hydrogenase H-cluster radical SAM maturase HydE [Clostridia bacterium]